MAAPAEQSARPTPVDVSSKILYKVDAVTFADLNSSLVHGWIEELDESIQATKLHIHERIQSELARFQQQLESSKSVQIRYETLAVRVDEVNHSLLDTEAGIYPTLVKRVTKHSLLAQDTSNAEARYQALSHLLSCRNAFTALSSFVQAGRLLEAIKAVEVIENVIAGLPEFLKQTRVIEDLNRQLVSAMARIQDQLSDAYSRSVTISDTNLVIFPQIQVRLSETMLPLPSILHSLAPASLSNHLAIFQRDFIACFVDPVLRNSYSVSVQCSSRELKLSLALAPSQREDLSKRFDNLSTVVLFLVNNFFPHLPVEEAAKLKSSLSKSITNNALNHLLVSALPSSFGLLPSFLKLLQRAVSFEDDISGLLGKEWSIKSWSDGVAGHYERRRRVDILEKARSEILLPDDVQDVFLVTIDEGPETTVPGSDSGEIDAWGFDESLPSEPDAVNDDAGSWTFGDSAKEASSWGLDEEMTALPDKSAENSPQRETGRESTDAWGWDEQVDEMIEDNTWDDPWADSTETTEAVKSPKPATRLQKKLEQKTKQNGHPTGPLSPMTNSAVAPTPLKKADDKANTASRQPDVSNTRISPESYLVPMRTRNIMKMVEIVIDESKLFYASNLFGEKNSASPPGSILSHSASSILDLYQAVHPVKHAKALEEAKNAFLFSNGCRYMAEAIQNIESTLYGQPTLKERLAECRQNLQISSDKWFEETIIRQQTSIRDILDAAQGFISTSDQDRYDECESAVNNVLQKIKRLAQQLKGVLTKSRYHTTIGLVADAGLSRMLQDILALPDITEVESHRLSELCRILNALEGLFSGDVDEPSFAAVYIPHWLKFSYLSELMEASLADITYLFEQGALVDFSIEELVQLVRALFADTPMRTNTINKLLNGHPGHS